MASELESAIMPVACDEESPASALAPETPLAPASSSAADTPDDDEIVQRFWKRIEIYLYIGYWALYVVDLLAWIGLCVFYARMSDEASKQHFTNWFSVYVIIGGIAAVTIPLEAVLQYLEWEDQAKFVQNYLMVPCGTVSIVTSTAMITRFIPFTPGSCAPYSPYLCYYGRAHAVWMLGLYSAIGLTILGACCCLCGCSSDTKTQQTDNSTVTTQTTEIKNVFIRMKWTTTKRQIKETDPVVDDAVTDAV